MSVNVWLPLLMLALVAVNLMIPAGRRALVTLLREMRRLYVEFPLRLVTRRPRANYARTRELEIELGYRKPDLRPTGGKSLGLAWSMAAIDALNAAEPAGACAYWTTFRPPEGDRLWLLDHAAITGKPVDAIITEALALYRRQSNAGRIDEALRVD